MRDLALFGMAIENSLRFCDLLRLRVRDVAKRGQMVSQVTFSPRNMINSVQLEISEETQSSLAEWIAQAELKPGDYLFGSRIHDSPHLSARQYARIVAYWISLIGLDPDAYGTESLRRTGPALLYKRTGDLDAVQVLLGHYKRETTTRFLGIQGEA